MDQNASLNDRRIESAKENRSIERVMDRHDVLELMSEMILHITFPEETQIKTGDQRQLQQCTRNTILVVSLPLGIGNIRSSSESTRCRK